MKIAPTAKTRLGRLMKPAVALGCLWLSLGATASAESPVDQYLAGEFEWSQQAKILAEFPSQLSSDDLESCLRFLDSKTTSSNARDLLFLRNDLADWMLTKPGMVNVTTEVLLKVIHDPEQPERWREFCLQKLPAACKHENLDASLKEQCVEVLLSQVGEYATVNAGTALLSLYHLRSNDLIELDPKIIATSAMDMFEAENATVSNRVTALQIAAFLGDEQALESARVVLGQDDSTLPLRVSAIGVLGKYGTPQDLSLISPFLESPDYRLRTAAKAATKRL